MTNFSASRRLRLGCAIATWMLATLVGTGVAARAQTAPAGTVRYYHTDALGSIRAVTDAQGHIVARHDYFPFGDEPANASDPGALRFTGKERDRESGMDYFGARYYASRSGRFTTVDPDHVGGNIFDPQSWNAYAYARNNPLRFIDPTGTDYFINVDGGSPFWFEGGPIDEFGQLKAWAAGYEFRGGMWGGDIYNGAGVKVGSYTYADKIVHLAWDISRRSGAVVQVVGVGVAATQVGLAFTNPVASTAADCLVTGCSAGGVAMGVVPGSRAAKLTRWGWAGTQKWIKARETLKRAGTHESIGGLVPTVNEAVEFIRAAGGTVDRIERGHAVGGVSRHTYPHINYTTASGAKATVKVQ